MTSVAPLVIDPAAITAAKAWLRIEQADEDGLIEGLIHAAMLLGEAYTGVLMIRRAVTERLPASTDWQRLRRAPVASIGSVGTVSDAGTVIPVPAGDYAIDIDPAGDGWVRLWQAGAGSRIEIGYQAGMAADWAGIPEPVRQGVIRLVAHGYTHRDDGNDQGPPAAVTALWRPWRRISL